MRLVIIAVDHPARRSVRVGDQPMVMGSRRQFLENTIRALRRPGVDGILASPDILENLLLLGELDNKVCMGSMNRGGLLGSSWELNDRFTAYDAQTIERLRLEGGKMLLRLNGDDPDSVRTLESWAQAFSDLAARKLMALVEPLPVYRDNDGVLRVSKDLDELSMAVGMDSSIGSTSAHSWLKLPAPSSRTGTCCDHIADIAPGRRPRSGSTSVVRGVGASVENSKCQTGCRSELGVSSKWERSEGNRPGGSSRPWQYDSIWHHPTGSLTDPPWTERYREVLDGSTQRHRI